jgi:hypothetical protein
MRLFNVDGHLPRQRHIRLPLAALRLFVQVAQLLARLFVAPVVGEVELGFEMLDGHLAADGHFDDFGAEVAVLAHRRSPPKVKVKPISFLAGEPLPVNRKLKPASLFADVLLH